MNHQEEISGAQAWQLAIRPKTLPAAVGPVLVGAALAVADDLFQLLPVLASLTAAILLQIASNLANDYFDFVRGLDQADRKGPTRVASSGLIPLSELRLGLILVLLITALIGLYLIAIGGWPILVVGVAGIISSVAYSAGPFPLASHGLGDLFVFTFFGLAAVIGTYYVQALTVTPVVVAAAIPPGALITAILVVNNLRDMQTDARVGKRTLAVRLGVEGTHGEYTLLLAVAYLVPVLLSIVDLLHGRPALMASLLLLPWLSLPMAARLRQTVVSTTDGPALNKALAGTARLSLVFCVLFSLGMLLSAL
ncbi:MAG: 1,4-dihydroxy-2-naphthoate polyprenyltransferase [Chloroflexota bacterium]|nr:1,4-dihydroxy-2-naphthoate polyprenyltransferase [Chloroflexota bacterium]